MAKSKTKSPAEQPGTERWKILALLTVTLLLRGRVTEYLRQSIAADDYGYLNMAGNLVDYGTLGWSNDPYQALATRMPLYTWVLAPCAATYSLGPLATGVLHLFLALLTVGAVWRLALRWELPPWSALLAAGLVALDPILVYETGHVSPTTLAACLTVFTLHALTSLWRAATALNALAAGICLALCGLCEPRYLLWIGIVLVLLVRHLSQQAVPSQLRLRTTTVLLSATLGLLALWPARNWTTVGYGTPLTSRSGYRFLLGNNPEFYQFLQAVHVGSDWDSRSFQRNWYAGVETSQDQKAFGLAFSNIASYPFGFALSVLVKLGWLWGLAPRSLELAGVASPLGARVACGVWYAVEFLLAIAGLRVLGRRGPAAPWIFGLLLIGCYTLGSIFSWCEMLDRGPIMPVVALLAALGASLFIGQRTSAETVESEDLAPPGSAANLP